MIAAIHARKSEVGQPPGGTREGPKIVPVPK